MSGVCGLGIYSAEPGKLVFAVGVDGRGTLESGQCISWC